MAGGMIKEVKLRAKFDPTSLQEADKRIQGFLNKYEKKDAVNVDLFDFRGAISDLAYLHKELEKLSTESPELKLNESFNMLSGQLVKFKEEFKSILAVFDSGSKDSLEDILNVDFSKNPIMGGGFGERIERLKQQSRELTDIITSISKLSPGDFWSSIDDVDKSQFEGMIESAKRLVEIQKQMDQFFGNKLSADQFSSAHSTGSLANVVGNWESELRDMERYNLQTTSLLNERKRLIDEAYDTYDMWGPDSQRNAKHHKLNDEDLYNEDIRVLEHYIDRKKTALKELQENQNLLFSGDSNFEEYVKKTQESIKAYQNYLDDLQGNKVVDDIGGKVPGNFGELIEQLKEIKGAIQEITKAFEPLTQAFANGDSALSKMLTASVYDLNNLQQRFKALSDTIDEISRKDFNVNTTNVLNQTISNPASAFKEQKNEAIELVKACEQYYQQIINLDKGLKILSKSGMSPKEVLDFQSYNADEILSGLRGARSQKQLDGWSSAAEDYRAKILEVLQLLYRVGAINEEITSISVAKKQDPNIINTDKASADVGGVLSEIKSIRDKINVEIQGIRQDFLDIFKFDSLDPNYDNIKAITDTIYNQFLELKSKINQLDLNLNVTTTASKGNTATKENIASDTAGTSANEINTEAEAMQNVETKADGATEAKKKFADANKKVAETAQNTSEEVAEEAKKMEQAAGAIVEASDKFDRIKYVTDADGNPMSKTTTSVTTKQNAIETEQSYYTYDKDGDPTLQAVTIIKNFKQRAAELKKEADKIALAQKTVDKFLSQFESKTAGQASTIKGFNALKGSTIGSLDDIEKATQAMLDLDNEYNKITKNFRQGTKSMNPFVNAITGVNEMKNKIKETEIAFGSLNNKPEALSNEVRALTPLFDTMMSFLDKDAKGNTIIKDIYGMSEAYGKLNSALRQVNSNIKIQQKINASQSKDKNFLLDFEKQLGGVVKQQAQWEKNGQLTDDLRNKIDRMVDSLAEVENASDLSAWKKEWGILKDDVAITKAEIDTATKAQKEEEQVLSKAINSQDKLYAAKKRLAKVDAGSAAGLEQTRKVDELQKEYDESVRLLKTEEQRTQIQNRQIQLEKELASAKRQTQNSYGKSYYNTEKKHYDKIISSVDDMSNLNLGLSPEFDAKLNEYKMAFKELEDLRNKFVNDPNASGNSALESQFISAKIKVEQLRTEVMGTFKEIQKFNQLSNSGSLLGTQRFDPADLENAKAAMIEYGAAITDGKLKFEGFNEAGTEMYGTLNDGAGSIQNVTVALLDGTNSLYAYRTGAKQVTNEWGKLGNTLGQGIKRLAVMYLSFYDIIRYVRKGLTYIKEIDLALTELKKVTDETDATYNKFLKNASDTASVIGSTVSDFTDATAAFARLGYSINESAEMAETAIVYKNVADGLDSVEESTDSIISTMKAYGIEANDTMGIIDRFNAVGNNFAITSAGIGEALQRSASALYAGGNTIDESIALVTAANSVIQNPEQVGTALKTLTLRLRGAKVELEEAGEDVDGMAESTSTLQAKLKALTHGKVDIMIDADTFKNTTQILREMSTVWDEMTDIEQASALELMGGKRQANILSSVIKNFETVEDVIETSMNSSGSAMAENEKWLDSIEGKTYQFTNALETMWSNMISSETAKKFIDFGTEAIKFLDTTPGKIIAIVAALGALAKFKGLNPITLGQETLQSLRGVNAAQSALNVIKQQYPLSGVTGKQAQQNIQAYANAVSSLTPKLQANVLATNGLNKEQVKYAMQCNGVKREVIDQATAHLMAKRAKDQEKLSGDALIQSKIKESAINLQLTGDSDKIAAGKWLEKNAIKLVNDEKAKELILNSELTPSQKAAALAAYEQANANTKLGFSFKTLWQTNPAMVITAIGTAAVAAINWIKDLTDQTDELKESYDDLQSSISTAKDELESIDSQMKELQEKIDGFANKNLTLAEAEELQRLKAQTAELEKQKELQESVLEARNNQNQIKSLSMISNLIKTTAANQEKSAENWAKWGKAIGAVLIGIGAVAATIGTAGAAAPAIGTLIAAGTTGAMAGGALGEWIGEGAGGLVNKSDSLIEWYETYTKAISDAEQKATEAESEYLTNVNDKNYENWQKKVEAVGTLQEEMYNGLQEMQSYIDNLEYNDQTKETIDEFNKLMTHISVTNMDGDIDAQISSIESLRDEYYELSKGVDEHGNNIALTAEEYARYQSIIAQVLGYNVGLTQSFNENGSAIYDAEGKLVSYNTVLAETIRLLKEQQRQAAREAIEGKEGDNQPLFDAYKSAQKNAKEAKPKVNGVQISGTAWAGNEIEEIIGKEYKWYESLDDYVYENASEIDKHLEEILAKAKERGLDDNELEAYREYLAAATKYAQSDILADQFKKTLSIVPQISESYDNLSGSQLSFVNDYISSLEIANDMSEDEIEEMKDSIVGLVDVIGADENLQNSINELIALDPSAMPVDTYKNQFNALWEEITSKIDFGEHQDAFLEQLFPDQSKIDTMVADIAKQLSSGSQELVRSLSLEELRIAYKIIPQLDDDLSLAELKAEIEDRMPKATGPIVETYSALKDQTEQFNEIAAQTSEIVLDNTKVTQEYKDALVELGISEEDLADCFDATNDLVVTNASKLNRLIKITKQGASQNVRLARSQAILQYHKKYQELKQLIKAQEQGVYVSRDQIDALRQEANVLEKAISRYAMLEVELLGAANAYEKFQQAQEIDSESNYIGSAEEMALALGKAFNTAELGSETAQAAIAGLVPPSVYEDLDTVDEKMAAIYEYFKNGKLSQYFTLEFDDDGNISSAEMKLGNLRKFIEDGLWGDADGNGINVFEGADWQHFELSENFIQSIKDADDPLQEFADQMNVTKEVAFAFLKTLNDHDIEWLNGDYASLFEYFVPDTLENRIYDSTQKLMDLDEELERLEKKYKDDKITKEEYEKEKSQINKEKTTEEGKLKDAKTESKQNALGKDGMVDQNFKGADGYLEANRLVVKAQEDVRSITEEMVAAQNDYNRAVADGADPSELNSIERKILEIQDRLEGANGELDESIAKRNEFAEPTTAELTFMLSDIEEEIKKAGATFDDGLVKYFHVDEDGYWILNAGVDITAMEQEYPGISKFVGLLNSETTIEAFLNGEDAKASAEELQKTVDAVIEAIEQNLITLDLDEEAVQNIVTQANKILEGISSSLGVYITAWMPDWMKKILDFAGFDTSNSNTTPVGPQGETARGQGAVNGTAHATGNWGLPTDEHDALVGELGTELVVDPQTGRYYTVGEHGAEFVDLKRGSIIFNHKQTESLLKNGYVTSRGKAYASGNFNPSNFKFDDQVTLEHPIDNLIDSINGLKDSMDDSERTWFQKGSLTGDGDTTFEDVVKTGYGTMADAFQNFYAGAAGIAENTIDAGAFLVGNAADRFGADELRDKVTEFTTKDLINEEKVGEHMAEAGLFGLAGVIKKAILGDNEVDDVSILGEKSDSIAQSGGQLAAQVGLNALGVPWQATSAVTSVGSETENALKSGATYTEAGISATIKAGAEILTEKLGGIAFGEKTLSSILSDKLTQGISSKFIKKIADFGVGSLLFGEGSEEALSELIGRFGQWLTYEDDKTLGDALFSEEALNSYLESYIGGFVLGEGYGAVNKLGALTNNTSGTNDLVSYHNIWRDFLNHSIDNGGFVSPSIAVKKAGSPHAEFGDSTFIFDLNSIDPKLDSRNKLYGSDAWTPAQTQLKMNAVFNETITKQIVDDIKNSIGTDYVSKLFSFSAEDVMSAISESDGSIYDAYAHNLGMQTAYAMGNNLISEIPTLDGNIDVATLNSRLAEIMDTDSGWRAYKVWLENISGMMIESYDAPTNEDILNNMAKQPPTAKPFKLSTNGDLVVPAVEYDSLREAYRNINRLMDDTSVDVKTTSDQFLSLANDIKNSTGADLSTIVDAINQAFTSRYSTNMIQEAFSEQNIDLSKQQASSLKQLYQQALELPTEYFEAKPQRIVSLDEVIGAVVPTDLGSELLQKMVDAGLNVVPYKAGDMADRIAKTDFANMLNNNSLTDSVKSELKEITNEYIKAIQEYNNAIEANGGKDLDTNHESLFALNNAADNYNNIIQSIIDQIRQNTSSPNVHGDYEDEDSKVNTYDIVGTGRDTLIDIENHWANIPDEKSTNYTVNVDTVDATTEGEPLRPRTTTGHHGTFVDGTAHASGSWGLPQNEHDSLVGELGTELVVDPSTGRYYTVGDNGAEMVDLPKGAIIFNHKQTEDLLKNGHVTSRGKAYAEGNAHVTIWPHGSSKSEWEGTGYSGPDGPYNSEVSKDLSDAADSISDAADEFREVFDWIEVRLEEINEKIDYRSAELENAVGYGAQNKIIDDMIDLNKTLYDNLISGSEEYYRYSEKLLAKVPEEYRDAAQDGSIAIEEFVGEVDEKTLNAIQEFRDWVQKGDDAVKEAEATLTEIANLAKQAFDNIANTFENKIGIYESANEQLEASVDLTEESGYVASPKYYEQMTTNTKSQKALLLMERKDLQQELDDAVASGEIEKYSDKWYEMVGAINDVDSAIQQCDIDLESYQNAINDIHWDNFDNLIDQYDYLHGQTQDLIDLMENSGDLITTPEGQTYEGGTVKFWTADDVQWTDEGLASLGLYAQQMEIAESEAQQYAEAIDKLTADYEAGLYSESEYQEKLDELTSAQYDSIESYYDAQDAIVDLNKTRVDSIKNGIEKEIEAYEELINKKKEELDTEKDLYDFQKQSSEQSKNIADIERKLAALANDNSMAAMAKRRQLEAELAEAKADQEELYYNRSIEDQQTALDNELTNFKTEKEAEIAALDEYLANVEQVVTDSLNVVQTNADTIGQTLTDKATEYNLTVSDAILTPWKDGANAVSDYQTQFDTAMSSTTEQLEGIKQSWQDIIDKMLEAADIEIKEQKDQDKKTTNQKYVKPKNDGKNKGNNKQNKGDSKPTYTTYTVKSGDTLSGIAAKKLGDWSKWKEIYNLNKKVIGSNPDLIFPGQKLKLPKYAKGTMGVKSNQLAIVDENQLEELVLGVENGRLTYLSKGSSVLPGDITSNLMAWGELDPQNVLDRNRPQIAPSQSVINNNMEISIDASVGTLLHVDHLDGNNPEEVIKLVDKAWNKKMEGLNNAIRRFSR